MAIIFWSEFPEEVDWNKVKREIDFDTEIYVACKDRHEYLVWKKRIESDKIKVGTWPILDKQDGYWFSGQLDRRNIDKLDDFHNLNVKIDVEPRIFKGEYNFFKAVYWLKKWLFFPGGNKQYLIEKVENLDAEKIISGFFLPKFVRKRVGMEIKGKRNFICYMSGKSGIFLKPYYKYMIKKNRTDNFYAIGLVSQGVFGNEPVYKNKEQLIRDLEFMKKLKVKNIAVYSIEGLVKRDWLGVVKDYVSSF